ncbi:MAG: RNA polymerase subunit sigma-24 [Chloroherpetonaceae bacterium]|nr:RNA polymerase subunit sigma-24 [Chloroherpetonaceae bacterium]
MSFQLEANQPAMIDRIDDVYNLAYWMCGNEATAGMLVSQTYLQGGRSETAVGLFKAFRNAYLRSFGQEATIEQDPSVIVNDQEVARAMITKAADFKMAMLLAEIAGLSHTEIAQVIEQPLTTVRLWLHWGRKLVCQEATEKVN